jgi:dTDP-D-glucose 4,6-dehydratase
VNIEKARRMLHWTPQVTLETGLKRTADWFIASPFAERQGAVSGSPPGAH